MATPKKPKVPETEMDHRGRQYDVFWSVDEDGNKHVGLAFDKRKHVKSACLVELLHDGSVRPFWELV